MLFTLCCSSDPVAGDWKQLPSLPDKEGFAGSFAGVSHGALLVAGGAHFPDKKPWEGGKKIWHDSVFVLESVDGAWRKAGKLPRPLGYGVSVTHNNGVICVGGSDALGHHANAFRLEWQSGQLVTTELPPLPQSLANSSGALVGDILYVAGGQTSPDSKDTVKTVWSIDLSAKEPRWSEVAAFPGSGRMLAVAAGFDGAFWLIGGVDLVTGHEGRVERSYLKDAYRFRQDTGWTRVADLPRPVVAAPSPAPSDALGFYVLGGDDGSQVGTAPEIHRGFSNKILRHDSKTATWVDAGVLPAPRVTTPCAVWHKRWVIPSGEMRPGVRSPEVWNFIPRSRE